MGSVLSWKRFSKARLTIWFFIDYKLIMTLRLEVQSIHELGLEEGTVWLEVSGSKAGTLVSDRVNSDQGGWDPAFRVDCNKNDSLKFIVVHIYKSKKQQLGTSQLICSKFIKQNAQELFSDIPFEYNIDILQDDDIKGYIRILAFYDTTILFQGEFPSKVSLSLTHHQDPLPIFFGKCPTKNAFSFLDETSSHQYCKFSESIYRDHA